MTKKYFDLEEYTTWPNYRWMQPPQIAYFVTTIDEMGNHNVTPVTLGTCIGASLPREKRPGEYYFSFSLGSSNLRDEGNMLEVRHGLLNLEKIPECVISFIPADLQRQSLLTGLPIPRGINEMDIAGLTLLPSKKVRPGGIKECPINLEATVIQKVGLGHYYRHYICKIVAATIDEALIQKDINGYGILETNPLFEVNIRPNDSGQLRLHYAELDRQSIRRTDENVGCLKDWIGNFEQWLKDEVSRGKISKSEHAEILELNRQWQANRDPDRNNDLKTRLTAKLRRLASG